eukprot:3049900-Rhodomonas_salina.2
MSFSLFRSLSSSIACHLAQLQQHQIPLEAAYEVSPGQTRTTANPDGAHCDETGQPSPRKHRSTPKLSLRCFETFAQSQHLHGKRDSKKADGLCNEEDSCARRVAAHECVVEHARHGCYLSDLTPRHCARLLALLLYDLYEAHSTEFASQQFAMSHVEQCPSVVTNWPLKTNSQALQRY